MSGIRSFGDGFGWLSRALIVLLTEWGIGPDPLEDRKTFSDRNARRRGRRALGFPSFSDRCYLRVYEPIASERRRRRKLRLRAAA